MSSIRNFAILVISALTLTTIILVALNTDTEALESTCAQHSSEYSVRIGC